MARLHWLVFALAVGWPGVAADESPSDAVSFNHDDGFTATGAFSGTCNVAGYRPDLGHTGTYTFASQAATMRIFQAWRNETVFFRDSPAPATSFNTRLEGWSENVTLPSGVLTLAFGPASHWFLSRRGVEGPANMTTSLVGNQWFAGTPKWVHPAGPEIYYVPTSIGLLSVQPSIAGPSRFVHTDQPTAWIEGEGNFFADGVKITGPDFEHELPPYKKEFYLNPTPVSVDWHVLFTHAIINVEGLRAQVAPGTGGLLCGDLEWRGSGAVTYRRASGDFTRANESRPFDELELTLDGPFSATEKPTQTSRAYGEAVTVYTNATGSFASVQLDFEPLSLPSAAAIRLDPKIPLAVALAALIGLMLKQAAPALAAFFTRLKKEPALQQEVRALIHEAVQGQPGITLTELQTALGRPKGTVRHHAQILKHFGVLQIVPVARSVHLFPAGYNREEGIRRLVLERDEAVRLAHELVRDVERPLRVVTKALMRRFGLQRAGAWKVVKRACDAKLVATKQTGHGVMVCALAPSH